MFKQLLLAIFLGFLSLIVLVQYDPWVKDCIAERICIVCPEVFHAQLVCNCTDISLWNACITLEQVYVFPVDRAQSWCWQARCLKLHWSWSQLYWYGTIDFACMLDDLVAHANIIDGKLDIADHLETLLNSSDTALYTFLKALHITTISVSLHDEQHAASAYIAADIHVDKQNNCFKTHIDLYDGNVTYQQRELLNCMSGSLRLDILDGKKHLDMSLDGAVSGVMPQLDAELTSCKIACSWQHNRGVMSVKNVDNTFVIDPIIIKNDVHGYTIGINAQMPLRYIWQMIHEHNDAAHIGGSCTLEVKYCDCHDNRILQGHAVAQRITYNDIAIGSLAKMSFQSQGGIFDGDLYVQRTSGACAAGSWSFDPTSCTGSIQLKNNSRLSFSPEHDWRVLPDDGSCTLTLHEDKRMGLAYAVKATHAKTEEQLVSDGMLTLDGDDFAVHGSIDRAHYEIHGMLQPDIICTHIAIAQQQPLFELMRYDNEYKGFVDIALAKEILRRYPKFNLQAEGKLNFTFKPFDWGYAADISLEKGAIRLPRTYNFVHSFTTRMKIFKDYTFEFHDLACALHNGKLSSKYMRASLAPDFSLRSCYVPILIEQCLFNMENELFAIVSGSMQFAKKEASAGQLKGNILLDRAQVKGNIFSDVFQKNMRSFTAHSFETRDNLVTCDINIQTKNPVKIQTPFLVTDARIDLKLHQSIRNPALTGSVQLQGGQLNFPYRPLYISKGALHFVPGRLEDPFIELVAKNSIKKNNIVLQATGSLQDHQITLESWPSLTEEQIISLLLVGSQEESLNVVMPALLMQNIKTLLFGYDQSTSAMSRYFNNFLKPFRRIHLVPSFVDQSGRGGLRGAIEIDISDRWRAIIEKNFSLTEDTRFEFEYLFSDDISMRIVRDIRRDLIAEVETRWKFGL